MPTSTAYILVIMIWTTTPLAVKWSSDGIDPSSGVFYRMLLASFCGWLLLYFSNTKLRWDRLALRGYASAALGIFGGMSSIYWAATLMPSGFISVVFGLSPVMTGILAHLYLNEASINKVQWLAFAISISGLSLLFLSKEPSLTLSGMNVASTLAESMYPHQSVGLALALLSTLFFSGSAVLTKKFSDASIKALPHTVGALIVSLPGFFLMWLLVSQDPWGASNKAIATIIYLGIGASLLGLGCYYAVLSRVSATSTSLITLITPVFALLLGQSLANEEIQTMTWIATGFIGLGLALYVWSETQRLPISENL